MWHFSSCIFNIASDWFYSNETYLETTTLFFPNHLHGHEKTHVIFEEVLKYFFFEKYILNHIYTCVCVCGEDHTLYIG